MTEMPRDKRMLRICVHLHRHQVDGLKAIASEDSVRFSQLIRNAITDFLEKERQKALKTDE